MTSEIRLFFDAQSPQRLDKFLAEKLPEYSRSRLQALIKDGKVLVDQMPVAKNGYILERENTIHITIPETAATSLQPEDIALDVVFETAQLIIINKAAGMVVHPAAGHSAGTLVNAVLAHAPDISGIGGEYRPGVVHRLDKDTSGLILLAKDDKTHHFLQEQFKNRRVKKTYLAITDGHPPTPVGRIEAPVGRDPSHRKKMAVVPLQRGREAVTEYRVLETFRNHTLLEARPLTGRTHQIRLHLAFLECPIVGDHLYGRRKNVLQAGRQQLHAWKLAITLPGETDVRVFEAPIPPDMEDLLSILRKNG